MNKEALSILAKKNKKQGHARIESGITNTKSQLEKAERNREIVHLTLDRIPKELWAYSGYWCAESLYPTLPWNWPFVTKVIKKLEANGWVKREEYYDDDGKDLHIPFYPAEGTPMLPGFGIYITVSATHPESKCVLVPLKVETKQVVTAYDHICPDSHPELFKFGLDGKWEYVGDELFPAIKEEE